jgi:hypothetical protein
VRLIGAGGGVVSGDGRVAIARAQFKLRPFIGRIASFLKGVSAYLSNNRYLSSFIESRRFVVDSFRACSRAAHPDTCGAAMEVPSREE